MDSRLRGNDGWEVGNHKGCPTDGRSRAVDSRLRGNDGWEAGNHKGCLYGWQEPGRGFPPPRE